MWANQCNTNHDLAALAALGYGENIYGESGDHTATGAPVDAVNGVLGWATEAANYNYAMNTCASGQLCGHYTQIVWRTTQMIGCGMKLCPPSGFFTTNWTVVVCDYKPAGNFNGLRPYCTASVTTTCAN